MIIQVQLATGNVTTLKAAENPRYFVCTSIIGGKAQRIGGAYAKQIIDGLDHACNENGAKLLFIDEAAVADIRARF